MASGQGAPIVARCIVCGGARTSEDRAPWCCPEAGPNDRRHVLFPIATSAVDPHWAMDVAAAKRGLALDDPHLSYLDWMMWPLLAFGWGADADDVIGACMQLGDALEASGSTRFRPTPLVRSSSMTGALGLGGVSLWLKDETNGVGKSHKARHLAGTLLLLLAAERAGVDRAGVDRAGVNRAGTARPPLAIASCGNAAVAAATLAAAVDWPLTVFVPEWMDDGYRRELERLDVTIQRCERRASDPPGDPTLHRFREAVEGGAIPFTVQGPENALCLDSGRTLGWEVADQLRDEGVVRLARAPVQVGGGALATSLGMSLRGSFPDVRIDPVQAAGCAPFALAMQRVGRSTPAPAFGVGGKWLSPPRARWMQELGRQWGEVMTPWPSPASVADGILDDETYDWLGVAGSMAGGVEFPGQPVVVTDEMIESAVAACAAAGFSVSATGAVGLAGLVRASAGLTRGHSALVILTGTDRSASGDPAATA